MAILDDVLELVAFIPLAVIAVQVILLRRTLASAAWTFIMLGFIVIAVLVGTSVVHPFDDTFRLVVRIVGYTLVAVGMRRLRSDLTCIMGLRNYNPKRKTLEKR